MNKQDKQFEALMKGIRIDSPSSDFTLNVMSRINSEAVVQKHHLLEDYKPVISKTTWMILIAAFVLLVIYITVSGKETTTAPDSGLWVKISGSLDQLKANEVSSIWQKGIGLFSSVPSIAYLILTASLALWTIDFSLTRLRHHASKIQLN